MILMIFLAVVVVGGLGYFFLPKIFSNTGETTDGVDVGVRDLKIVDDYNSAVFSDPRFTPLRTYGAPPDEVDLNRVGRPNPFAPLL